MLHRKIFGFVSRSYKAVLLWGALMGVSSACQTWPLFLSGYFVDMDGIKRLVGENVETCLILFAAALIPIDLLGTMRYGCKKLKLDSANGLFLIFSGIFILAHFFFSGMELYSDLPVRVCLLLFVSALLVAGPIDPARRWYLPTLCVCLEAVLFIKLLREELILMSVYFALAETAFVLSSFWVNRRRMGISGALKIVSLPACALSLSVSLLCLTQRDTVESIFGIWAAVEENTLTWYSAANAAEPFHSACMHITMVSLNLIGLGILLLAARRRSKPAHFSALTLAVFDLAVILCGIAVWYDLLPSAISVLMPFSSTVSAIIAALACNSLLYENRIITGESFTRNPVLKTILELLNPFDDDE